MAQSPDRPLSPHLQVYKWGPAMFVSIMHRATGAGLAIVGMPILLWWLYAIAMGGAAFECFIDAATHPVGIIVLIGLTFSLFEHIGTGLRHFVLDIGAGYELNANKFWAMMVPVGAVVATAVVWGIVYMKVTG